MLGRAFLLATLKEDFPHLEAIETFKGKEEKEQNKRVAPIAPACLLYS
jgi:hypothetical protein